MKKGIYAVILGLFVLVVAMLPQPAAAFDIFVENSHERTMSVALRYYEDSTGKWVVEYCPP